jgi:hypothetical protein
MAAQYVTLEEAAERLGIPTDEFKRRLKTEWTHLVPMRDGPTLRFRVNQIDELARQLGAASDPDLPLASMEDSVEHGSDDFKVADTARPKSGKHATKPADEPLMFDTSDDDVFSLSAEGPKGKSSGDSSSDSDVRLESSKVRKAKQKGKGKDGEPDAVPTEEIALDMGGPSSAVIKGGSSAKLTAPKSSAKLTAPDSGKSLGGKSKSVNPGDSSEFELSLDADSDDFELQLNTDSSDEVDLGSSPVDEADKRSGKSGINLRDPADSGVSLEKGKKGDSSGRNLSKKSESGRTRKPAPKPEDSDSDVDFELSLEAEPEPAAPPKSGRSSGRKPVTSDSDSEFELTLDDSGEGSSLEAAAEESRGDIFETDFEIPPMADESGSEAVALDSDTDLEADPDSQVALEEGDVVAEEETGSQVVVLEDEPDAATSSARRKASARRRAAAEEGDVDLADVEEESASGALRGVKSRRGEEDEDEAAEPSGAVRAAPSPWGPVPAIILIPSLLFVILGGLMSYELLHTMTGYQQPRKPTAPLVRGVAKTLDMELRDQ